MNRLFYRLLLFVYPKPFREEYGRELEIQFANELREGLQPWKIWFHSIPDALLAGGAQHTDLLSQDFRHTLRSCSLRPVTSVLIIILLALGLGATLATFEAAYSLLLRPLPYPADNRLVMTFAFPAEALRENPARMGDLIAPQGPLEASAVSSDDEVDLNGGPMPLRVRAAEVSPNFFSVLGRSPEIGAWFSRNAADGTEAVLGYALWQQAFGGDPGVLGRTVALNGAPRRVVGVAPPGVDVPHRSSVWVGVSREFDTMHRKGALFLEVLGRMRPGWTAAATSQALQAIAESLDPARRKWEPDARIVTLFRLREISADSWEKPAVLMLVAAAMALLLTCCSVGSLQLARTMERRNEINIRMALGAPASRIARQFRTEMLLLMLAGSLTGWLVYKLALLALPLMLEEFPIGLHPSFEAFVILLILAIVITSFLGFAPRAQTVHLARGVLAHSDRSIRSRAARGLLIAQVAVATVLLIGFALFGQSLSRLLGVDLGMEMSDVVTAKVSLSSGGKFDAVQSREYYERALGALRSTPGVASAGVVNYLPLGRAPFFLEDYRAQGLGIDSRKDYVGSPRIVSADYFWTLRIPLLAGRVIDESAPHEAGQEVLVNREFAERLGGIKAAVGARIRIQEADEKDKWLTIIGVVENTRYHGPEQAGGTPEIYQSYKIGSWPVMTFVVKTANPDGLLGRLRSVLALPDHNVNVFAVRRYRSYLDDEVLKPRLLMTILGGFGAFCWILSLAALIGTVSHDVARSMPEVGIRMALGASRHNVIAVFVARHAWPVGIGLAFGLGGAAALSRMIQAMLFSVRPLDPAVYGAVVGSFASIALLAVVLASLRATKANPASALRAE